MSRPSDVELLAALRVVASWLGIGAPAPADYDQHNLPPGVKSKAVYLRLHSERRRAGVPGWTSRGQVRSVSADAWRLDVDTETARRRSRTRLAVVPSATSVGDELDRRLGIRLHAKAGAK